MIKDYYIAEATSVVANFLLKSDSAENYERNCLDLELLHHHHTIGANVEGKNDSVIGPAT